MNPIFKIFLCGFILVVSMVTTGHYLIGSNTDALVVMGFVSNLLVFGYIIKKLTDIIIGMVNDSKLSKKPSDEEEY